MSIRRNGGSILEGLLGETGNLLASIPVSNPLGLILFDERSIVAKIDAESGEDSRERILRTLLEMRKNPPTQSPFERASRSHADLAREIDTLSSEITLPASTRAYWKRLSSFRHAILPFYRRAESQYFGRLRKQGAFKAFNIICTLPEPILAIAISDGQTNLDGLVEGAKSAKALNHQVVLAILQGPKRPKPASSTDAILGLNPQSSWILRCSPSELSRGISGQILDRSYSRSLRVPM
jgi:hypothetical protein